MMPIAGTTRIRPTAENGLRQALVVFVCQRRAMDRRRMQERIGTVHAEVFNAMFEALGKLTSRRVEPEHVSDKSWQTPGAAEHAICADQGL